MGTAQSSTSSPISVQSGTSDPNFDKVTSGVRITTGTAEQKVDNNINFKAAYDKGHEDGVNTFQSSLEQVAAQVYDGVHKQLADIQNESLAKSKELVAEVQKKLTVPGSFGSGATTQMPCVTEQSVLLNCLKEKKGADGAESLACKEAVDAYSRCAMSP